MLDLIQIRLSPSRVEKHIDCPSRWGRSELEGHVEPGSEATELGTIVHALREQYYLHGTPFDLTTRGGWLAAGMSPDLPRVLPPGGAVELELTYAATTAVTLVGRLDLCYPSECDPSYAVVRDYKTTGSMRYAKLERDALFGHSQAPLYALMWMNKLRVKKARCGWVYVETSKSLGMPPWPEPALAASDHYITHDEATERVHMRMLPVATAMLQARDEYCAAKTDEERAAVIDALPRNLTSCYKYNKRCPHWARCQPEKAKDMSSLFLQAVGANVATQQQAKELEQPVVAPTVVAPAPNLAALTTEATADEKPDINPPEPAGKPTTKGKKGAASAGLTEAEINAIADAVVQRMALRLIAGVQ